MSSNATSTSSSEDGLSAGIVWVITFFSTALIFSSIMFFVCCDAFKKYKRRVPREFITGRGNYPRQEPSTITQGTVASTAESQSDIDTTPQRSQSGGEAESTDKQIGQEQTSGDVNMPSTSNKKSTLPPLDGKISTVSETVPEGRGTVNAGFTDKPLPSIQNKSDEIVLTPVTSLNLGVSIYS
uniref:Uncharacterized protein LOC111102532 n=1 Tax=Crassostrea virginica TaxID=6565 RepID=A0A8B8AKC0_CRAVI|nr:uncharacterized protein LOC111102532 [Crassostrea virginica]